MKKHLIVAAVAAAVAVPAAAQVTVGGTLDIPAWSTDKMVTGANTTTKRKGTAVLIAPIDGSTTGKFSTSTLNFSGSEDLGGGLKASFFVNQTIDSNSGGLGNRDRFLQLEGGFGAIRLGRFSPAFEGGYSSFAVSGTTNTSGTTDSGFSDLIADSMGTNAQGLTLGRQAGLIQYTTPSIGGVVFTALIADGSSDLNTTAGKVVGQGHAVTATLTSGPLSLGLGYGSIEGGTEAVVPARAESDVTWVGASYNFGRALVKYAYGTRENELTANALTTALATAVDISVHNIGVSVPLGSATIFASYYDGKDKATTAAGDDLDVKGHQVGLRYNLSKRTFAYAVHGKNKETAATAANVANNYELTQTTFGLAHSF
jgi:predicted porin